MSKWKTRTVFGILAILFLIAILYLKGLFLYFSVVAVSLLGVHELNSSFRIKGHKPSRLLSAFFVSSSISLAFFGGEYSYSQKHAISLLLLALTAIISNLILFLLLNKNKTPVDIMVNIFSILYILIPVIMFVLMRDSELIYLIFIITICSDTAAYIFGSKFGKKKLAPKISPKKTVFGAVSAVATTLIVTMVFWFLFYKNSHQSYEFFIVGFLGSIYSQLGDLVASMIKRYCGIKDFGKLIPGHGGILDRLDSVFFVTPIVFMLYLITIFSWG